MVLKKLEGDLPYVLAILLLGKKSDSKGNDVSIPKRYLHTYVTSHKS
jgi:hypothetical protein